MPSPSTNFVQRRNESIDGTPRRCKCELPPKERTGWRWENPGRRFWNCPNSMENGCDFFKWKDEELAPGYFKELIYSLKQQLIAKIDNSELGRCRCKIRDLEAQVSKEQAVNDKLVEEIMELELVVVDEKDQKEKMVEVMGDMRKKLLVLMVALVLMLVACLCK